MMTELKDEEFIEWEEKEVMASLRDGKRESERDQHLSPLLFSITDPRVKDDDELANFPKLPVDALESDKLSG